MDRGKEDERCWHIEILSLSYLLVTYKLARGHLGLHWCCTACKSTWNMCQQRNIYTRWPFQPSAWIRPNSLLPQKKEARRHKLRWPRHHVMDCSLRTSRELRKTKWRPCLGVQDLFVVRVFQREAPLSSRISVIHSKFSWKINPSVLVSFFLVDSACAFTVHSAMKASAV